MQKLILILFLLIQYPVYSQIGKISLLFVGDIMCHGPQIKSAQKSDYTYDFNSNYKFISPLIKWADISIGNLETTIRDSLPYTGYPRFRAPKSLVSAIKNAGFDIIVTANNHSNDNGEKGIISTINTINNQNLYQTGTFKSKEEKDGAYPLLYHKDGFLISILNYTYGTNGLPVKGECIVNIIDENEIKKDIEKAKISSPDLVLVIMHWGWEYNLKPNKMQKKLAKKMFEWGADLIVGSHPHVVQPISKISYVRDSIQKEGIVAWSLGNFISNQSKKNTDGGLIFTIDISRDINGDVSVENPFYIPVWRYIEKTEDKKNEYRILPVEVFENDTVLLNIPSADKDKMKSFAKKVRNNIGGVAKEKKVNYNNYYKLINAE